MKSAEIKKKPISLAILAWTHQLCMFLALYIIACDFIGLSFREQGFYLRYSAIILLPLLIVDILKTNLDSLAPAPVFFLLFPIAYVYLVLFGEHGHLQHIVFLLLGDVICYFIFSYIQSSTDFIHYYQERDRFPLRSIKRNGYILLCCFMISLSLFLIPAGICTNDPLDQLTLPSLTNKETSVHDEPGDAPENEADNTSNDMAQAMANMKDAPEILTKLAHYTQPIIIVIVIIIIIALLLRMLSSFFKKLSSHHFSWESDEIIFLKDVQEDDAVTKLQKNNRLSFFGEEASIRRKYKREIRRSLKGTPRGSETPSELEAAANLSIKELHNQYEKIRYQ